MLSAFIGTFILALHLTCSVILIYRTDKDAPLISCYSLVLGFFGLYFLLPAVLLLALTNGEFVWVRQLDGPSVFFQTAFLASLALGLFQFGYWFGGQRPVAVRSIIGNKQSTDLMVSVAVTLALFGIVLKLFGFAMSGGIVTSVTRMSSGLSDVLEIQGASQAEFYVRMLSGIGDAAVVWLLAFSISQRRFNFTYLALFLIVLVLSFLGTGKRSFLILPMIAIAISYHKFVKPISIKQLPFTSLLILGIGFATLMSRIFLPLLFNDVQINLNNVSWAEGSILRFYFLSLEFATFEAFSLTLLYDNQIVNMFGDAATAFYVTNIQPLFFMIPRSIWQSKPDAFIDISHAVRALMHGGSIKSGGGIAPTLLGTSWVLGGVIGLGAVMLICGYISSYFDKDARFNPMGIFRIIGYSFVIVLMFQFFRQGTVGWTLLTVLIQQLGLILGFVLIFVSGLFNKKKMGVSRSAKIH